MWARAGGDGGGSGESSDRFRLLVASFVLALLLILTVGGQTIGSAHASGLVNGTSTGSLDPGGKAVTLTGSAITFRGTAGNCPLGNGSPAGCFSAGFATGALTFHGGFVMHNPSNYLIFWLPPGQAFDNSSIDPTASTPSNSNYESLIQRYFTDLSGSSYYGILQQYTDITGAPGSLESLGGVFVDPTPLPGGRGTTANPLTYADIENEIQSAVATEGWSSNNGNNEFFLFSPYNVFTNGSSTFCAFHSSYTVGSVPYVYSLIPDAGNSYGTGSCLATDVTGNPNTPNGSPFADSTVNLVAHEQFESVSDPQGGGWFYLDQGHEIADECAWIFGTLSSNGGNIVLGGHGYIAQEMWSNSNGGCYLPPKPASTILTLSYGVVGGGSGYTPPTLTYVSGGLGKSAVLGNVPVAFSLDTGTGWSVNTILGGSTGTERWQTNQPGVGTAASPAMLSFAYYHQVTVSFGYTVTGGGVGYSSPAATFSQFGVGSSVGMGTSVWADSQSAYSFLPVLPGSGSSERWFAPAASGTVSSGGLVTGVYHHQYVIAVSGGGTGSGWFDAGTTAVYSTPALYGRVDGTGSRVSGYSLDGSPAVQVAPTLGNVTVMVVIGGPHTLSISSVTQREVSLDVGAQEATGSMTPPTVSGDGPWYDEGTQVSLSLNGVWSRGTTTGERLVGYSLNGVAISVAQKGAVQVLSMVTLTSPRFVRATVVAQYLLNDSSPALVSVTPPPIQGDAGWYDAGSSVVSTFNHAWQATGNLSRQDAVAYVLDGKATSVGRKGGGTFSVVTLVKGPHSLTILSVTQYSLGVSGGDSPAWSVQSPTGDAFLDSGTQLTVSTSRVWNVTGGNSRESLFACAIDGVPRSVGIAASDSGNFTSPVITMDSPHTIYFVSVHQYLVTFDLVDDSGTKHLIPSNLAIDVDGSGTIGVQDQQAWMDSGARFGVARATWEGVDVSPLDNATFVVEGAAKDLIRLRVFEVNLAVTDYLGVPAAGARVSVTLSNGTILDGSTAPNGTLRIGFVPLGTYKATVTYLGSTSAIDESAPSSPTRTVRVISSYPTFVVLGGAALVGATALVVYRRRRNQVTPV